MWQHHWVTAHPNDTRMRHWKNNSPSALWREQWLFDRLSPSLSLSTIARSNRHRQRTARIDLEGGKETLRVNENRVGSVGHYLLLTIFMCLSIAEISTRCDDIDWHAVKPSDMRLRRSPPTSTSAACVVLSRPTLFLHCKRSTLYLHALPQPGSQIARAIDSDQLVSPAGLPRLSRARERLPSRRNRLCIGNSALAGMPPD